jgi:hypothetical protein
VIKVLANEKDILGADVIISAEYVNVREYCALALE